MQPCLPYNVKESTKLNSMGETITTSIINEELEFWEQNRFPLFINDTFPNKVPDIQGVAELLNHVKETGDYYAVQERIKHLKQQKKKRS